MIPTLKRKHPFQVFLVLILAAIGITLAIASYEKPVQPLIALSTAPQNTSTEIIATSAPKNALKASTNPPAQVKPVPVIGNLSYAIGLSVADTLSFVSNQELQKRLDDMASLGVGWIRIDIDWGDVQPQNSRLFQWDRIDRVVAVAKARNIQVLAILVYTPPWARPDGCGSNRCPPAEPSSFAAFAAAATGRYAPLGVHDWEIWNEPNLRGSWLPGADGADYATLLKTTSVAIKNEDPSAQMENTDPNLRSVMEKNGDSVKKIWITEYGAPTGGPGALATAGTYLFAKYADHVSEDWQAHLLTDAVAATHTYPWAGPFFWYSYQDIGTSPWTNENFFGLLRYDGSEKPAYTALKQAIASLH
ncbi:hypothetical protein HY090_03130 [Candidatus Kaiserbacteria bacterium]|nr:hypothetical protein [Candidatus Kaiserbacteria bacterium]